MKTNHLRQEFSPIGIAVELLQDATDELDSFKLLFGDDIVDYIVAETKLYAQQRRSESDIVCNARRTKKRLLVVE